MKDSKGNPIPERRGFMDLDEMREEFFVRVATPEDRVAEFAKQMLAGQKFPDQILTESGILVDGRTRKGSYEIAGITKNIPVRIIPDLSRKELILLAWKCNEGGSLPSSSQDKSHNIRLLFDQGLRRGTIVKLVSEQFGLERKYVSDMVDQVQSNMVKDRVRRAAISVRNGDMTPQIAAAAYEVDLKTLLVALGDKTEKPAKDLIHVAKGKIQKSMAKTSHSTGHLLGNMFTDTEKGDVSKQQMLDLVEYAESQHAKAGRAITNWRKRAEALPEEDLVLV